MGMGLGVFWFGFAIAVGVWASNRGRFGFGWFILAVIISPLLAAIFLAVTKNKAEPLVVIAQQHTPSEQTHVRCPQCAEFVLPEALKCKHCGAELTPDTGFEQRKIQQMRAKDDEESKNLLIGLGFIVALIVLAKWLS